MYYVANPIRDETFIFDNEHLVPVRPMRRIHKGDYHPSHQQTKRLINWYFRSKPDVIQMVEIGCGNGNLLKLLGDNLKLNGVGYEPCNERALGAQKRGLNVVNGFFTSQSLDKKVDIIVLDNVLEHLIEPREVMQSVSDAVKPDGILIVLVPNLHDIRRYFRPDGFWTVYTHINYFNRQALKRLLWDFGFNFYVYPLQTLSTQDWKFVPKVLLDNFGLSLFGHYCFGVRR